MSTAHACGVHNRLRRFETYACELRRRMRTLLRLKRRLRAETWEIERTIYVCHPLTRSDGTTVAQAFGQTEPAEELMQTRLSRALALFSFAAALAAGVDAHAQTTAQDNQFVARDAQGNMQYLDDRAGFGRPGQWTFSTDTGVSISRTTISNSDGALTIVKIEPAADYFVIENLSVGGMIGLQYTKAGNDSGTRFTIGPRVGYNIELSRLLSVWPKIGFSFAHTNEDAADDKANSLALNLFAPLMVHPAEHFFAGFGPFLDTDMSGDTRSTTWGVKLTLGGWI
jgi:hypothetical protein